MIGIRKIGQIRHYLSHDITVKLVHAFVTSRLDSCNSLLFGLPEREMMKVQRVQNTAARLVLRIRRQDHITPALEDLHWLPVCQRVVYKILLLTYKSLHDSAPVFVCDIIHRYVPSRSLRSASESRLVLPNSSLKSYGDRSFAYAAPFLWNNLPIRIRKASSLATFKSQLKTHLFKQYFYP